MTNRTKEYLLMAFWLVLALGSLSMLGIEVLDLDVAVRSQPLFQDLLLFAQYLVFIAPVAMGLTYMSFEQPWLLRLLINITGASTLIVACAVVYFAPVTSLYVPWAWGYIVFSFVGGIVTFTQYNQEHKREASYQTTLVVVLMLALVSIVVGANFSVLAGGALFIGVPVLYLLARIFGRVLGKKIDEKLH